MADQSNRPFVQRKSSSVRERCRSGEQKRQATMQGCWESTAGGRRRKSGRLHSRVEAPLAERADSFPTLVESEASNDERSRGRRTPSLTGAEERGASRSAAPPSDLARRARSPVGRLALALQNASAPCASCSRSRPKKLEAIGSLEAEITKPAITCQNRGQALAGR